jgi:serine/threonine-protein kinase RsbW
MSNVRLEIASSPERIAQVRHFVRDQCRDSGLKGEALLHVELAVGEAVSNIVRHAYAGAADRELWVEVDNSPEAIAIRLFHWGDVFDPASVAAPAFDGSREHGFGVYIIEQCMDDVVYSRDLQGRNCVCLIKKRY